MLSALVKKTDYGGEGDLYRVLAENGFSVVQFHVLCKLDSLLAWFITHFSMYKCSQVMQIHYRGRNCMEYFATPHGDEQNGFYRFPLS